MNERGPGNLVPSFLAKPPYSIFNDVCLRDIIPLPLKGERDYVPGCMERTAVEQELCAF